MLLLKIFFIHSGSADDDTIEFRRSSREADSSIAIVHRPGDSKIIYRTSVSRNGATRYIRNLLTGLEHDIDPCLQVQIMSAIAPCVLYKTSDIKSNVYVRESIEESLEDLFNHHVTFTNPPAEDEEEDYEGEYEEEEVEDPQNPYADMPALVPSYYA
jgi:hypothetical protein